MNSHLDGYDGTALGPLGGTSQIGIRVIDVTHPDAAALEGKSLVATVRGPRVGIVVTPDAFASKNIELRIVAEVED